MCRNADPSPSLLVKTTDRQLPQFAGPSRELVLAKGKKRAKSESNVEAPVNQVLIPRRRFLCPQSPRANEKDFVFAEWFAGDLRNFGDCDRITKRVEEFQHTA
jgi:hypothetical protein